MWRLLDGRDFTALAGSLAAIAAVTALLRMLPGVSAATVALTLLLIVLGAATLARLRVATLVSVVAMLTLNFFFLPPVGAFTIADPQNWVVLCVFLAAAIIASHLSAAAQDRAREAVARRNEVTRLFDLTRDVLLTTDTGGAIGALVQHVARRFDLAKVAICLPADGGWHLYQGGREPLAVNESVLNAAITTAREAREFNAPYRPDRGDTQVEHAEESISIVPLRHGTRAVGLLAAVAPALDVGSLGALAGVVAIAIERAHFLAERENAELVRQKAELAAALLASLSHDLKTPLTAIRVAVENVRDDRASIDRRAQADLALSELDRLTRLFEGILDMARIDAAAIRIERQWVTPADVVDAAMAHVRHALDGHNVRVDGDDSEAEIQIDPRLASSALSHLLENAARYSPRDREIVVDARAESHGLYVSVTDHGPGLDASEVPHLFERFYRGRTARQLSAGTGMGLAITRGLLAAAGGRVWAENVPGAGARFTMVVPGATRALASDGETSLDQRGQGPREQS